MLSERVVEGALRCCFACRGFLVPYRSLNKAVWGCRLLCVVVWNLSNWKRCYLKGMGLFERF